MNFSKNTEKVQIVVGTNQWKLGTKYKPAKFIMHESYNYPNFAYDIGLIRTQTPIEFTEKVQPIKFSKKFIEAGTDLMVTGWGRLEVSLWLNGFSLLSLQIERKFMLKN